MRVQLHPHFAEEKKYVLRILLETILGGAVEFSEHDDRDTILHLASGRRLRLVDHFFHLIKKTDDVSTWPWPQTQAPYYGTEKIIESESETRVEADWIALCFFMLSRWEEARFPEHFDQYGRFSGLNSFAHQAGFLDRPVVDEIAFQISKLTGIGPHNGRGKIRPTHDIDFPLKYGNRWIIAKQAVKALVKLNLSGVFGFAKAFFLPSTLWLRDPYNSFDEIMKRSESAGTRSCFFMMAGGDHELDYFFPPDHPFLMRLYREIRQRGHSLGLHPSFASSDDVRILKKEKKILSACAGEEIQNSRQHFLKIRVPETFEQLADLGFETDFTMGYHDVEGFRIGTSFAVPAFSWKKRRELKLSLVPLIFMDGTLRSYRGLSDPQILETVGRLADQTKKFGGDFCFLWHNNTFKEDREIYSKIMDILGARYGS